MSAPWEPPENLGPEINVPETITMAPFISADGCALYFMSTRPDGHAGPDCRFLNCFDLYVATRSPNE